MKATVFQTYDFYWQVTKVLSDVTKEFSQSLRPIATIHTCYQGCQVWPPIRANIHQMGQIWDFLRSVFSSF